MTPHSYTRARCMSEWVGLSLIQSSSWHAAHSQRPESHAQHTYIQYDTSGGSTSSKSSQRNNNQSSTTYDGKNISCEFSWKWLLRIASAKMRRSCFGHWMISCDFPENFDLVAWWMRENIQKNFSAIASSVRRWTVNSFRNLVNTFLWIISFVRGKIVHSTIWCIYEQRNWIRSKNNWIKVAETTTVAPVAVTESKDVIWWQQQQIKRIEYKNTSLSSSVPIVTVLLFVYSVLICYWSPFFRLENRCSEIESGKR